jgi:hypothetical protein
MLPSGKTAEKVRQEHDNRIEILKAQPNLELIEIWECDINRQLEEDLNLKKKLCTYLITTPWLRLRDGFVGGRTQPARMLFNSQENSFGHRYKIRYLDFTSLYPFVQTQYYPVGHPQVIVVDREDQQVLWTDQDQVPWNGFIKVIVNPPRRLPNSPPVLPVKVDERLLFSLCRSCAREFPYGGKVVDYNCLHSEEERSFVWTGTTMELRAAIKQGYTVTKVFSAWHYDEFSNDIFRGYVGDFMSMKIHASGYEPGMDTVEERQNWIKECHEKFGIVIDELKMNPNAAKRSLAKLANNSLWGKFAERENLTKTITTNSPAVLREYLDSPKLDVLSVQMISEDVMLISYKKQKDFVTSNKTNNLAIAAWTTSLARLRLLETLQAVARLENLESREAVLLYWDTDSVIYGIREGFEDPLKFMEGAHLGDLKDEKEGFDILEFCSCGPKNYSLVLKNVKTKEQHYEMKVRGITLDYNTCQKLHYEKFKEICLSFGGDDEKAIYIEYDTVLRPDVRTGNVYSVPLKKIFRPVIRKGIVNKDYKILDFGASN